MDRLYVSYEKYRRMIAEKKILHRLVQGVRILTVALACYGWWGVIYPELTMLPSTYGIVYEETEATEAETVQTDPEVVEWNSDSQIYWKILEADPEQIRFKSRLLTMLKNKRRNPMYQENVTALKKDAPIGVFDSGIGGLTVAREIMRQIPNEKIIYFGDTARMPYGSKSKETVTRFSKQIVRFLETFQVKTIVVACNTASAYALDELEKEIDVPIIGVIKPGARTAAEVTRNGRIGVIATEATIGSQMYNKYIQELNKDVTIYGKACPLFVPLVEEGLWEDPVTDEIAKRYLSELIDIDIDTLILGCTHYPLIRSTVGRVMGDQVTLVNPAYETARELKELLQHYHILNDEEPHLGENKYQFYVSDGAEKFKHFANSIIKYGILSAKTIKIDEY